VHAQAANGSYEMQRLSLFLTAAGYQIDPEPEGKRIAWLRIERREVFEPDDLRVPIVLPSFASTWPNHFHWLTEHSRIRRELLLHKGERYVQRLADESMRNLRGLGIIALASIVPVKTPDPTLVGVIVYTRDLWSLRLEQSFTGAGSTFSAAGQLVERNFLGRGASLSVRGAIDPIRFSVGQTLYHKRLLDQLSVYESFDVLWKRQGAQAEGSTGTLILSRPWYNLAQHSAYSLYLKYADYVSRDTQGANVVGYDIAPEHYGQTCELGPQTCLARVFRDRQYRVELNYDYRIGRRYKQIFSGGFTLLTRQVAPNAETGLLPEQEATFREEVLPKVRRDIYPYVRYRLSLPDFAVFSNLTSFKQSETVRVGPSLDGFVGLPLKAYGASSDGLVLHGEMTYVWAEHDTLLDVGAEGYARLENGRALDQRLILHARGATPEWPAIAGRLVARLNLDVRHNDSQRTFVALGGDNGIRGYPAQNFYVIGGSRFIGNVEYRSSPIALDSVHFGFVVFYDAGAVYASSSGTRAGTARTGLHQAAGTGVRFMFPQFNRGVFRCDVGVPFDSDGSHGLTALVTYSSEQFVPLTATEDEAATDTSNTVRPSL